MEASWLRKDVLRVSCGDRTEKTYLTTYASMNDLAKPLTRVRSVPPSGSMTCIIIQGLFFRFERGKRGMMFLEGWVSPRYNIRSIAV